jgi:hypothetical protein
MKKKALALTALAIILIAVKPHTFAMFKNIKMPNMPSMDDVNKLTKLKDSLKRNFEDGTNVLSKDKETLTAKLKEYETNHSQAALNDFLTTITTFNETLIGSVQKINDSINSVKSIIGEDLQKAINNFLNEIKDAQLLLSTAIALNQPA